MNADERFETLGLELPPVAKPAGLYKPAVVVAGLCHVSGHLPLLPDGSLLQGRVGDDVDLQAGYEAAQRAGLAILATLTATLGSLQSVQGVVKTVGMVNATADFYEHPSVINGCSELFAKVWGDDHGVGARSASGVASLPKNVTVEIEAIFELK